MTAAEAPVRVEFLDLTLADPAQNLALDEALLDEAEYHSPGRETLRLWESSTPLVVLGRSSDVAAEVNEDACRADRVPVFRRSSGGLSIVTGPGCLMYSVVLDMESRPELKNVSAAHRFVLNRILAAIKPHVPGAACRGTSDLVLGDRKFSGNSLRQKRRHLLYHGTLLYGFPLESIARYLKMPPRMPEYRNTREHRDFVTNLPLEREMLRAGIISTWEAHDRRSDWPVETTERLAAEKYAYLLESAG